MGFGCESKGRLQGEENRTRESLGQRKSGKFGGKFVKLRTGARGRLGEAATFVEEVLDHGFGSPYALLGRFQGRSTGIAFSGKCWLFGGF